MTGIVPTYRVEKDDFKVEFEVLTPIDVDDLKNPKKRELAMSIQDLDVLIDACEAEVRKMDVEIDKFTNHADGLDYAVSVASGVLCGLIDSFFVGETNTDIDEIRKKLEEKYHTANDSSFKHKTTKNGEKKNVSSPKLHRLEDMAHHPTIGGLLAAIFVRFLRLAVFSDGDGKLKIFFIEKNQNSDKHKKEMKDMCVAWSLAVLTGVFVWIGNIAKNQYTEKTGEDVPVALKKIIDAVALSPAIINILLSVDSWIGHIMSDVSTSAGVPGIILSFLKEISTLPIIKETKLPKIVKDLYRDKNMNVSKYACVVFSDVKQQSLPVIINESLVRGFYFLRRLIDEYKEHGNFKDVNWENVIPFGNRTVERMMTIATGTFTAVDIADAAIRSGGFNPACLLRVNFVGVGRFAVAIVTDAGMGIKRNRLLNERIKVMSEQMVLLNAKVSYKCAAVYLELEDVAKSEEEMWIAAENTEKTLMEVYEVAEESVVFLHSSLIEIQQNFEKISQYRGAIEEKNPGLVKDLINITKWGKK